LEEGTRSWKTNTYVKIKRFSKRLEDEKHAQIETHNHLQHWMLKTKKQFKLKHGIIEF
jgi:hypothetical protein